MLLNRWKSSSAKAEAAMGSTVAPSGVKSFRTTAPSAPASAAAYMPLYVLHTTLFPFTRTGSKHSIQCLMNY